MRRVLTRVRQYEEALKQRRLWVGCYKVTADGSPALTIALPEYRCCEMDGGIRMATRELEAGAKVRRLGSRGRGPGSWWTQYVFALKEGEVWPLITTHCTTDAVKIVPNEEPSPPAEEDTPPMARPAPPSSTVASEQEERARRAQERTKRLLNRARAQTGDGDEEPDAGAATGYVDDDEDARPRSMSDKQQRPPAPARAAPPGLRRANTGALPTSAAPAPAKPMPPSPRGRTPAPTPGPGPASPRGQPASPRTRSPAPAPAPPSPRRAQSERNMAAPSGPFPRAGSQRDPGSGGNSPRARGPVVTDALVVQMLNELSIRTREFEGQEVHLSFTGVSMTSWLLKTRQLASREEAVRWAQAMQVEGVFYGVEADNYALEDGPRPYIINLGHAVVGREWPRIVAAAAAYEAGAPPAPQSAPPTRPAPALKRPYSPRK